MTDANTAIDIVDEPEGPGADLNRQADAFLAENADRRPVTSVREAVKEDAGQIRRRARQATVRAREHVTANPRSSVLYAVGAGVLLGLILAR